jgi:hypothetical protein
MESKPRVRAACRSMCRCLERFRTSAQLEARRYGPMIRPNVDIPVYVRNTAITRTVFAQGGRSCPAQRTICHACDGRQMKAPLLREIARAAEIARAGANRHKSSKCEQSILRSDRDIGRIVWTWAARPGGRVRHAPARPSSPIRRSVQSMTPSALQASGPDIMAHRPGAGRMCRRGPDNIARRTSYLAAEAPAEFDASELTTRMTAAFTHDDNSRARLGAS